MAWTRVKDKETGHEYSVAFPNPEAHDVLEKPAEDRFGVPLPTKLNRPLSTMVDAEGTSIDQLTKPKLIAYAETHQIDLGEASLRDDILAVVIAHEQGGDDSTPAT